MKTPQELIRICMKDFERSRTDKANWLPFKQAWFRAYDLGFEEGAVEAQNDAAREIQKNYKALGN